MTTDRELMQQALDALERYEDGQQVYFDDEIEALRARLAQPEQEPVATLFGSLPVYDVPTKQKPVAWVETLENARPHCVTDLNYLSVAQHERGEHLKYTPLYIDPTPCQTCESLARTVMMDQTSHDNPPQREWQGLTDEEIEKLVYDIRSQTTGVVATAYVARAIEAKLKEKNI